MQGNEPKALCLQNFQLTSMPQGRTLYKQCPKNEESDPNVSLKTQRITESLKNDFIYLVII